MMGAGEGRVLVRAYVYLCMVHKAVRNPIDSDICERWQDASSYKYSSAQSLLHSSGCFIVPVQELARSILVISCAEYVVDEVSEG